MAPLAHFKGPCSWFGGPDDDGVDPDEGLAFFYEYDDAPHLFLDEQPPGTTGLARRLNPDMFYVACRWDYSVTPKEMLRDRTKKCLVTAGGETVEAWPADWGPHVDTGRAADLSQGLMDYLNLDTDDEVEVIYPVEQERTAMRVAMSSGHGRHVRGASGYIDEVDEARRVIDNVGAILTAMGAEFETFHDNESKTVNENLNRIVDWHNKTAFGGQPHDWDVSVHFNAFEPTDKPMGTEVLYVTQSDVASTLSALLASAAELPNRGGKYRSDLFFLNKTKAKALLLEVCFVDSSYDAEQYKENFDEICQVIVDAITGGKAPEPPEQEEETVNVTIYSPPNVLVNVKQSSALSTAASSSVDILIESPPSVRIDVSINEETHG